MSKKSQPSFELKKIIWDIAATVGKDKPAEIQRQLDIELEKLLVLWLFLFFKC
jgi:hypothetical protein